MEKGVFVNKPIIKVYSKSSTDWKTKTTRVYGKRTVPILVAMGKRYGYTASIIDSGYLTLTPK
jgi:hypothetical protein